MKKYIIIFLFFLLILPIQAKASGGLVYGVKFNHVNVGEVTEITDGDLKTYYEIPYGEKMEYTFPDTKWIDKFNIHADGDIMVRFHVDGGGSFTYVRTNPGQHEYQIPESYIYKHRLSKIEITPATVGETPKIYEFEAYEKDPFPIGVLRGLKFYQTNRNGDFNSYADSNFNDGSMSTYTGFSGTRINPSRAYITHDFSYPVDLESIQVQSSQDIQVELYTVNGLLETGTVKKDGTPLYFQDGKNVTKLIFYFIGGGYTVYEIEAYTQPDTTPPGEVTNVTFTPAKNSIWLSWENPPDPDLLNIEIYLDGARIVSLRNTHQEYIISGLKEDESYEIKILTVDNAGNKSSGYTITTRTLLGIPNQPKVKAKTGNNYIDFEIYEVERADGYRIYREDPGGVLILVGEIQDLEFTVSGLDPGKTYTFYVSAFNHAGESKKTISRARTKIAQINLSAWDFIITTISFISIFSNIIIFSTILIFAPRLLRFFNKIYFKEGKGREWKFGK